MTSINDFDLIRAFQHAEEVARIATSRGYSMPAEWKHAAEVVAAAEEMGREPEPVMPALPAANKLPAAARKFAAERRDWRDGQQIAEEWRSRALRDAARIAIDQAPHLARQLAKDANEDVLPRLVALLDSAPHEITGYESPEQSVAHSELRRTVNEATLVVAQRLNLAIASGESTDLGHATAFLLINPGPDALISAVDSAIAKIGAGDMPATIDAWNALRPVGLQLAYPGEAGARRQAYNAARANLIATPDGGVLDHTIGELAATADDPEAARRVRALSR